MAVDQGEAQAERIVALNGVPVRWRIGAIAYFHNDALEFYWRDPQPDEPEPRNPVRFDVSDDDLWQGYYEPVLSLLGRDQAHRMIESTEAVALPEADVSLRVAPNVLKYLLVEQWALV